MTIARLVIVVAFFASLAACIRVGPPLPDNQSTVFCLAQSDWPRFLSMMDQFGREQSLKRYGGIQRLADDKPILNATLRGGHDFIFFGTDFDLSVMSDPFRPKATQLTLIRRDKVPKKEQWALARLFLQRIRPLVSPAAGSLHDPSCA
jgi:hypothetical protein